MGCSVINETQQMPFLCKRDPVSWTHTQHHRHQTTTIKNPSHQQYAPPKTAEQVCAFLGLTGYYRKFTKDFTKIAKPLTLLTHHKAKFDWDTSAPHSLYDTKESHHKSTYPALSWPNKEVHSLHRCIGWCMQSWIIKGTWWNWIPNSILISHLHWHTNKMECPRTGSLESILFHNQVELLPSMSWYHSP